MYSCRTHWRHFWKKSLGLIFKQNPGCASEEISVGVGALEDILRSIPEGSTENIFEGNLI